MIRNVVTTKQKNHVVGNLWKYFEMKTKGKNPRSKGDSQLALSCDFDWKQITVSNLFHETGYLFVLIILPF